MIRNAAIDLTADGVTPRGGGGVVAAMDLSARADESPVLGVAVGNRNTLKALRLMLRDSAGRTGEWRFVLPAPGTSADVVAAEGASLADPPVTGKEGKPDLSRVQQWQLIGDFAGDGPVDLQVTTVSAASPDADLLAARAERKKRDDAARADARRQRDEARQHFPPGAADAPVLDGVYCASPTLLAIRLREGNVTPASFHDYKPLPGDQRQTIDGKLTLVRDGKPVGLLVGPPGRETGLSIQEGFSGAPLLTVEADDPSNYVVHSTDDPAFAKGVGPTRVRRKSKPDDWQQFTQQGVVVEHTLYLEMPTPLSEGKTYAVSLGHLNASRGEAAFTFSAEKTWTEAIHVSQLGFRPDDPAKHAFLSLWTGNGGGYDWPDAVAFRLVDDKSGEAVYSGVVGPAWSAEKVETMQTTRNFNGTSVRAIDFSAFNKPGRYRVVVDGVGTSYPFDISADVWQKAFVVQMKGFYNERSGVALGPPYTTFVRPVCLKPGVNDAMPVTQSTFSNLDNQGTLAGGDTGQAVFEAWGGYHDAGDWNPRRASHMTTTTFWQLDLLQMFPAYFGGLKLNVPNDAPGPDLLKECLFELSLFRRLQLPDGGVRWGIETDGDPYGGETSWKQHMPEYVYAADAEASYIYAAVAARAAGVLWQVDKGLSATYQESALRAMQWAESDRTRRQTAGTWDTVAERLKPRRNLAAVCLLALTKDAKWNTTFLEDTSLKPGQPIPFRGDDAGRDAAFAYARLPAGVGDEAIKARARTAIVVDADATLDYQQHNAFGIASSDPGKPQFLGFYSSPHGAVTLVRAHYLTHDPRFLAGAVNACLFPGGANPSNIVYTSGLGTHAVKALNLDAIATGQSPPVGLTPYGNVDLQRWAMNKDGAWIVWPINYFLGKHAEPAIFDWPTTEAYFDVRFWPVLTEFCVDQTMGPAAYVWGYLAAR